MAKINKNDFLNSVLKGNMELFEDIIKIDLDYSVFKEEGMYIFEKLYSIYLNFISENYKIYDSNLFINGVLYRTIDSFRGCLWSFSKNNNFVFFDSYRNLCETLGLLCYANQNPNYIKIIGLGHKKNQSKENIVLGPRKLIGAGNKKYPHLEVIYNEVSGYIHPNPESLLMPLIFTEKEKEGIYFKFLIGNSGLIGRGKDNSKYLFNEVLLITKYIYDEIIILIDKNKTK